MPRARVYDLVPVCELPYGPAAPSLHQRPDRWQHPTTCRSSSKNRLRLAGRPQMSTRPNHAADLGMEACARLTSADCDVHGRATGRALCDGNAQLGGPSSNRRCTVAHPPRDLAGKHSRARQPSQGLVFNFGPADSLAQALPPMSPVPIASCAATTAATSKHDARGVFDPHRQTRARCA